MGLAKTTWSWNPWRTFISASRVGAEAVIQNTALRSANAVAKPGMPLQNLMLGQCHANKASTEGWTANVPAVRCHKANSNLALDLGIAFSCLDCDSLVPGIDKCDADVVSPHQKGIQMATMKTEGDVNTKVLE